MSVKRELLLALLFPAILVAGQTKDTLSGTIKVKKVKKEKSISSSDYYTTSSTAGMPVFPGGDAALMQFIRKNIKYPLQAKELDIQGKVMVLYTIDQKGNVTNVQLMKSAAESGSRAQDSLNPVRRDVYAQAFKALDEEALRVVRSLPKWTPAMINGKPTSMRLLLPVRFDTSNDY